MSKNDKPGLVSVKMKTGLSRGNMRAVAGEVVDLPPGLARRLVDRNMASLMAEEKARQEAKSAPRPQDTQGGEKSNQAEAAKGQAQSKPTATDDSDTGTKEPPEAEGGKVSAPKAKGES